MNFWQMGTVQQYAGSMARQTLWDMKQKNGDFFSHRTSLKDYTGSTGGISALLPEDKKDDRLTGILSRAEAGRKLSPDEWEYLLKHHPDVYQKLKDAEQEEKNFEEALHRCKTRDEAERLHVSRLSGLMAALKSGDASVLLKLNRLTKTMVDFTESRAFHDLPTESEQAIEREQERKAREEVPETGMHTAEEERPQGTEDEVPEQQSSRETDRREGLTKEADRPAQDSPEAKMTGRDAAPGDSVPDGRRAVAEKAFRSLSEDADRTHGRRIEVDA